MNFFDKLRACLSLQIINEGELIELNAFGRARMRTGEHPLSEKPQYYMLYWVCLPVYECRLCDYDQSWRMHQMVLVWHGKKGFGMYWKSAPTVQQ